MKICPNCGKTNPEDARFCAYCASGLEEQPETEENGSAGTGQSGSAEESVSDSQLFPASDSLPPVGGSAGPDSEFSEGDSLPSVLSDSSDGANEPAEKEETSPQGIQIGFVQPKIITRSESSSKEEEDTTFPPAKPPVLPDHAAGRPPRFDKKEQGGSADEDTAKKSREYETAGKADTQKKGLIAAVSVLAVLAAILAGVLLYQNFWIPAQQLRESSRMEPMDEMNEAPVTEYSQKSEDSQTEVQSDMEESREPISFSSKDYREKAASRVSDFADEESEDDPLLEDEPEEESSSSSARGTDYQTLFVMKVREEPSLDAEQTDRIAQGQTVVIDQTKTDSDGSLWGHLANDKGWVCIHDSEQDYLVKEDDAS